ncbi:MAG: uracil-DNA glycosylase [Acidobacteria bacterium]|nr:uracil-DNA glycosylase [Acidobacteriota bacterium]
MLLNDEIVRCRLCPRLVEHREEIARVKRKAYRDQDYWGRPVPSFGDPAARLLVVGLAPGAHGANRTGRMFTGDRSGDFLYRALYETGFASQPESAHSGDGLRLTDCYISAPVHCAPPDNKPTREEIATCSGYLRRELPMLKNLKAVVVLGRIALDGYRAVAGLPVLPFGHGLVHPLKPALICSYHPSQQNTQTGRLTAEMLRDVFASARRIINTNSCVTPSSL